jgi:signal transduction histidine kinase
MNNQYTAASSKTPPRKLNLKRKLVGIVIGVGAVPLVLAMAISYKQGNQSLMQTIGSSFKVLAFQTASTIDIIIQEEFRKINHLSTHPTLILSILAQNKAIDQISSSKLSTFVNEQSRLWEKEGGDRSDSQINRGASRALLSFIERDANRAAITKAFFVTDARGILIASTNKHPSFNNADRSSWKAIMKEGRENFIGDLFLDPKTQTYLIEMAVPVVDRNQKHIGVLHRLYSAKEFLYPFIESIAFGDTGHVMLIDSKGKVLACPILPTGHQLQDPELVQSVTGPKPSWVQTMGDGHGSHEVSIIGYSPLKDTSTITATSTGKSWYTFTWQSPTEVFALTKKLFWWMAIVGLLSIFIIAIASSIAAQKIVRPIQLLQKAAGSIGRGKQVAPLNIKTGDEIEVLADEINSMQILLQQTFNSLEQKVEEKTQEILYLKEYSESILRSVPEAIFIFNRGLSIEYVNFTSENLLQDSSKKWLGQTLRELPQEPKKTWDLLAKNLEQYSKAKGEVHPHKIPLAVAQEKDNSVKDPLAPQSSVSTPENLSTVTLNNRIFAYKFFDVVIKAGSERRSGLILKDVTEEKQLLDQLTRADKLSGLGTLAAGIAHELNNPLQSIMGFSEAIIKKINPSKHDAYAKKIYDRSKRMASVISDMSGYVQSSDNDFVTEVDINEQIEAAAKISLMTSYSSDIIIEKNFGKLPLIKARSEEIKQLFLKIIQNAVQAMEGRGTINITTQYNNDAAQIRIKDTGPGIPREYLSKIFDPFFTTKEQGLGSGLGLNMVHHLVKKHEGSVKVISELGKGAEFIIVLPVAQ